jgi:hypothetical protein
LNDTEVNDTANRVLYTLARTGGTPGDALAVMVVMILNLYEHKPVGATQTFAEFAEGFKQHCIATYNVNTFGNAPSTEEVQ